MADVSAAVSRLSGGEACLDPEILPIGGTKSCLRVTDTLSGYTPP